MKVGTDGVLLGVWCTPTPRFPDSPIPRFTILDIGTGSGLIALILAQRVIDGGQCTMHDWVHIDAIDIDPQAVEQATYNFAQSPWSKHLSAHLSPLQSWHPSSPIHRFPSSPIKYDLIVSNPPYFVDSLKNPDKGREQARHTDTLSYEDLLKHSARLLNEQGTLALVLPASAEEQIIRLASNYGLYPVRLTRVYSKPDRPTPIRILIEFCKKVPISQEVSPLRGDLEVASLCISSSTSPRSAEYVEMTKDFYL